VITTCQVLVSGNLARERVVEMADVLKDMAKNCMTRYKFNYPGILCLSQLLCLLVPPFHQLGDQSSRAVFLKILQGLVSQNFNCTCNNLVLHFL